MITARKRETIFEGRWRKVSAKLWLSTNSLYTPLSLSLFLSVYSSPGRVAFILTLPLLFTLAFSRKIASSGRQSVLGAVSLDVTRKMLRIFLLLLVRPYQRRRRTRKKKKKRRARSPSIETLHLSSSSSKQLMNHGGDGRNSPLSLSLIKFFRYTRELLFLPCRS